MDDIYILLQWRAACLNSKNASETMRTQPWMVLWTWFKQRVFGLFFLPEKPGSFERIKTRKRACVCARGSMLRSAQERRHSDLSLPGKMHHNVPLHFRPAQFSLHVALVAISFAGCVLGCSFSLVFSSTQHPAQIKKTRYLPKSASTILHYKLI